MTHLVQSDKQSFLWFIILITDQTEVQQRCVVHVDAAFENERKNKTGIEFVRP